jgi:hypothetical protein
MKEPNKNDKTTLYRVYIIIRLFFLNFRLVGLDTAKIENLKISTKTCENVDTISFSKTRKRDGLKKVQLSEVFLDPQLIGCNSI